jgi:hypothetical protein
VWNFDWSTYRWQHHGDTGVTSVRISAGMSSNNTWQHDYKGFGYGLNGDYYVEVYYSWRDAATGRWLGQSRLSLVHGSDDECPSSAIRCVVNASSIKLW